MTRERRLLTVLLASVVPPITALPGCGPAVDSKEPDPPPPIARVHGRVTGQVSGVAPAPTLQFLM